jgi:hypothetical protein
LDINVSGYVPKSANAKRQRANVKGKRGCT